MGSLPNSCALKMLEAQRSSERIEVIAEDS